jgi:pimeloyl-ACP methyl ester carboxylesterase
MRGDPFTAGMRALLTALGYQAPGWGLGVNFGPTPSLLTGTQSLLTRLAGQHGPVSLVGFSLGGLFARWLALHQTGCVRGVITIGSPINDAARNYWVPLSPFLRLWPGGGLEALAQDVARPLPVPSTVLYSSVDGLVGGTTCIDASAPGRNVQVPFRHVRMACDPAVAAIIADRLAQPQHPPLSAQPDAM